MPTVPDTAAAASRLLSQVAVCHHHCSASFQAMPLVIYQGYLYSAQCKWRNGKNNRLGLGLG